MQNDFLKKYLRKIYIYNGMNFEEIFLEKLKKNDIFKLVDKELFIMDDNKSGIWIAISDVNINEFTIEAKPYILDKYIRITPHGQI